VLVLWRNKLRASKSPQRIFDAVRTVITASGVIAGKTRRALDFHRARRRRDPPLHRDHARHPDLPGATSVATASNPMPNLTRHTFEGSGVALLRGDQETMIPAPPPVGSQRPS